MSEIICVKLSSGEEVIGTLQDGGDTYRVLVGNARVLVMQPTGPGQFGVAMMPWMISGQDDVVAIKTEHVVGELLNGVPKQLEDAYLSNTSGIQLAASNDNTLKV